MAVENVTVTTVQFKHNTKANLAISNPLLLEAEKVIELDTGREKVGPFGAGRWNDLPYTDEAAIEAAIDAAGAAAAGQIAQAVDGLVSAPAAALTAKVGAGAALINDINEWWVDPVAFNSSDARGAFTFKGTVGAPDPSLPLYPTTVGDAVAAPIILSEWRAGFPVRSVVAGVINADDHNVPAVRADAGKRRLAIWSGHYADNKTTFALSDRSGSLDSMSLAAGNSQTFTRTGLTSYAQVFKDAGRSTSTLSYYWLFQRVRRGTSGNYSHGWTVTEFTVDETADTGGLTLVSDGVSAGHGQRYLIRNADGLAYMTGYTDGTSIHVLWGQHPSGDGRMALLSINMASGAITGATTGNAFFTPADANQGAVYDADFTWATPTLVGERRRFFYREADGYVWAKWTTGDEDNAVYKYSEANPPDAFDGLRTTALGYAEATYRAEQDMADGFDVVFKGVTVPGTLSANTDVGRRYEDSANGTWFVRVNTDGKLSMRVERTGGTWNYTSTTAVTGLLGGKRDLRLNFVGDEGGFAKCRFYWRASSADAWTALAVGTYTGPNLPKASTAPLRLGWGSSPANLADLTFEGVTLSTLGGTVVVDQDFLTGWPAHTATDTDAAGQAWTLSGNAVIGSTSPTYTVHDLGVAGPRIGHGPEANYIPGACILVDSTGKTVGLLTVHRVGDESTVRKWTKTAAGAWVANEVDRQAEVLARPYQPRGGQGPIGLLVSAIREYGQGENEFVQYASDAYAHAAI